MSQKEKFQQLDFVMLKLDATHPDLNHGARYAVDTCKNGSTSLINIETLIKTSVLETYPEDPDNLIDFALKVIENNLVTMNEGRRMANISEVYFRNLVNSFGGYDSQIFMIGGKQFIRRSLAEKIVNRREEKDLRQEEQLKVIRETRERREDFVDGEDDLEALTLPELRAFAKQIETFKSVDIYQNKPGLISAIRQYRAAQKENK